MQHAPRPTQCPNLQTLHGKYVNLFNPVPHQISIEDIAESLSRLCRFNGHCQAFYSVAQHSVLVSELIESQGLANPFTQEGRQILLYALLNDAHVAYLGDMTYPVKQMIKLLSRPVFAEFQRARANLDAVIFMTAGLPARMPQDTKEIIKAADLAALAAERRDLLIDGPDWPRLSGVHATSKKISPAPWPAAHAAFITRFEKLATTGANTQEHDNDHRA